MILTIAKYHENLLKDSIKWDKIALYLFSLGNLEYTKNAKWNLLRITRYQLSVKQLLLCYFDTIVKNV